MSELDELIATFRLEAGELLNELAETLRAQRGNPRDQEALVAARRIAHNLKGAALTVGAQRLVEPCEVMESEIQTAAAGSELPSGEQFEIWLRGVTDMLASLGDPNVIASTSFAAAALARASLNGSTPDVAGSTRPPFAGEVRTDSPMGHPSTPRPSVQQARERCNDSIREGPGARRRILLVDDSLIVRTVEEQVLDSEGYDVTACADGEEAWAVLERQAFDLVICDVQMPKLDGFELTSRMRASATLHRTPVLLVTGRSAPEDITRGAQVGADGYITKEDLAPEELTAVVRRLLG